MRRGILAPPRFRLKRGGMMKRFKLSALLLCLVFCLSACTQRELPDAPSESLGDSSLSGSDIISQSKTEPEPYKIALNDELIKANNANRRNGGYIMEEERYIVYRHPADNGRLYRYEKATGAVKVLYNTTALNGFLHSIQFFDNKIYFVTKAESDESPTLYCTDIEGESLERLIENVGDDYIVTDDMIYYTTYRESNGEIFYLYRYDRKRKESALMRPGQCEYLNLVGDEIYFVDYTFTGESIISGGGIICKINIRTNECEEVLLASDGFKGELTGVGRLLAVNNKLFFTATTGIVTGDDIVDNNYLFVSYDLQKQKIEIIYTISNFNEIAGINEIVYCPFSVLIDDHYYIYLNGTKDCALLESVSGQLKLCWKSENRGLIYIVENEPVVCGPSEGNILYGEKAKKLMVKAGET